MTEVLLDGVRHTYREVEAKGRDTTALMTEYSQKLDAMPQDHPFSATDCIEFSLSLGFVATCSLETLARITKSPTSGTFLGRKHHMRRWRPGPSRNFS